MRFREEPLEFQTSSQRGIWVWLDPDLVPDLVNSLCLKDNICAINPLYHLVKITKFQTTYSQFSYQVSDAIKILSTSRSNLERHPYPRGDPGMQRAALQESSASPGLPAMYGVRWLNYSYIPARHLGHCTSQPLVTVMPSISLKSNFSGMQWPPQVVNAWA